MTVVIDISNMYFGKLKILSAKENAGLEESRQLFEQYVAFPLALWFNKKNIEDLTATRLKNDFVYNLATGNYASFSEMVRQGANLHFDLTRPYTCIVLKASLRGNDKDTVEYSERIACYIAEIEEILLREGAQRGRKIMVSNLSLEFVVFLENRDPSPRETVEQYLDAQIAGSVSNSLFLLFFGDSVKSAWKIRSLAVYTAMPVWRCNIVPPQRTAAAGLPIKIPAKLRLYLFYRNIPGFKRMRQKCWEGS